MRGKKKKKEHQRLQRSIVVQSGTEQSICEEQQMANSKVGTHTNIIVVSRHCRTYAVDWCQRFRAREDAVAIRLARQAQAVVGAVVGRKGGHLGVRRRAAVFSVLWLEAATQGILGRARGHALAVRCAIIATGAGKAAICICL